MSQKKMILVHKAFDKLRDKYEEIRNVFEKKLCQPLKEFKTNTENRLVSPR